MKGSEPGLSEGDAFNHVDFIHVQAPRSEVLRRFKEAVPKTL